jgi:hypothetical protein
MILVLIFHIDYCRGLIGLRKEDLFGHYEKTILRNLHQALLPLLLVDPVFSR